MSVIGPSCSLTCKRSEPGRESARWARADSSAAAASAGAAFAAALCTACCVLPFTLPAAVLAIAGGSIAVLDHARSWVSLLAVVAVASTWGLILWQIRKTGRRVARSALVVVSISTVLAGASLAWPLIKPWAMRSVGALTTPIRQSD